MTFLAIGNDVFIAREAPRKLMSFQKFQKQVIPSFDIYFDEKRSTVVRQANISRERTHLDKCSDLERDLYILQDS